MAFGSLRLKYLFVTKKSMLGMVEQCSSVENDKGRANLICAGCRSCPTRTSFFEWPVCSILFGKALDYDITLWPHSKDTHLR